MYCSKCGTKLADDTVFCSNCGQPTGITVPLPGVAAAGMAAGPVERYRLAGAMLVVPSPYAGFWLRLLAYLIDHILLGVVLGVVAMLTIAAIGVGYFRTMIEGLRGGGDEFPVALVSDILAAALFMFAVTWIYHAWMESSPYQGTLGKMALGLIVTDLNDRPVTFGRASGRFFARIISNLIPLGIGYIMAGFTEKKQALHDMIAGCLVLRRI
jgi:uncharacterized RDD family membrane protein YckC